MGDHPSRTALSKMKDGMPMWKLYRPFTLSQSSSQSYCHMTYGYFSRCLNVMWYSSGFSFLFLFLEAVLSSNFFQALDVRSGCLLIHGHTCNTQQRLTTSLSGQLLYNECIHPDLTYFKVTHSRKGEPRS